MIDQNTKEFTNENPINYVTNQEIVRGIEKHAEWLKGNPDGTRLDLSYHILPDTTFDRADLRGARFFGTNLRNSTFRDCNVSGSNFSYANLWNSNFNGSTTHDSYFYRAQLTGSKIEHECPAAFGILASTSQDNIFDVVTGNHVSMIKQVSLEPAIRFLEREADRLWDGFILFSKPVIRAELIAPRSDTPWTLHASSKCADCPFANDCPKCIRCA